MSDDDRGSIKVETKWDIGTGEIFQNVSGTGALQDTMARITRQIIRTQEEGIRRALMGLGWTPPPEKKKAPLPPSHQI